MQSNEMFYNNTFERKYLFSKISKIVYLFYLILACDPLFNFKALKFKLRDTHLEIFFLFSFEYATSRHRSTYIQNLSNSFLIMVYVSILLFLKYIGARLQKSVFAGT